ncbi:hypothetical protein BCR33DRAFT_777678 [Rhizoclosmatium globosum]|uniref:ABC transporter domain-containing protein n=1 Tax=Rhizoclosmatium globosum TaxID=329046 RepID=A0A1Y2A6D6_9FUNG|nr:hypothetical protein BCR33DRAFT_777678 [Rhizoclosmatium globosum]|eukprot:ORY18078.1 hypothetical protein BCR33DRAFT_777678 [Rhizoclosmatium globosum]
MTSYDLTKILLPGNCYVSQYSIGYPITDYGYSCAPHFYCPNSTASVVKSLPQLCTPTADCVATRLKSKPCTPQGPYEPQLCPAGSYCPDPTTLLNCPSGYYCPVGTVTPIACPPLSNCPESTIAPTYFGGIVICAIVDIILVLCYFGIKYDWINKIQSNQKTRLSNTTRKKVEQEKAENDPEQGLSEVTADEERRRSESVNPLTCLGRPSVVDAKVPVTGSMEELSGFIGGFRTALEGKEDVFIDFKFENLGLKLKEGKTILKGVNGSIRSKRLTAIMGPSGCGKTTFMSVLMGKVARTSGTLLINEEECEMSKYKKIIGYVPQEDIMLRELTVRENIFHSARTRLPKTWTAAQVNKYVDDVLDVLNLSHVQHSLIGSETERGVSGGQRKRVNIGMELGGVPIALFLDEPTSGLDSTSSLKVAEILRKIASLGLTIVAVIHQPRYEIFQQFNDILMLVPGGKTAYIGPTAFVVAYFKELGYFFDALANPADILMDILSGKGINQKGDEITPDGLVDRWESFGQAWVDEKVEADTENQNARSAEECAASTKDLELIVKNRGAPIWTQIGLCHNRYIVQQYRQAGSLVIEIGVASLAGLLMGIAIMGQKGQIFKGVYVDPYSGLTPSTVLWLIPQLGNFKEGDVINTNTLKGLLVGMACGLAGAPAGVKVFAEEQSVYWREAANGHDKLGYFTGKAIASIYRFILSSLHFASIFVLLGKPASSFGFVYAVIMLQFWSVYGMAMLISMIVRREDSALLAVVVCLFCAVFCGYGPTIKDSYSMGITFLFAISYNRWAIEAWFSQELSLFQDIYQIGAAAENYGYVLGKEAMNLGLCFFIGLVLRMIAFALMVLLHRDKQKGTLEQLKYVYVPKYSTASGIQMTSFYKFNKITEKE